MNIEIIYEKYCDEKKIPSEYRLMLKSSIVDTLDFKYYNLHIVLKEFVDNFTIPILDRFISWLNSKLSK